MAENSDFPDNFDITEDPGCVPDGSNEIGDQGEMWPQCFTWYEDLLQEKQDDICRRRCGKYGREQCTIHDKMRFSERKEFNQFLDDMDKREESKRPVLLTEKQEYELELSRSIYEGAARDDMIKEVFQPKRKRAMPVMTSPATCLEKIQNVLGHVPRLLLSRELGINHPQKRIHDIGGLKYWKEYANLQTSTTCPKRRHSDNCNNCCDALTSVELDESEYESEDE